MHISKQSALLATIVYGEIFGYPLTKTELLEWFLYYSVRDIPASNYTQRAGRYIIPKGKSALVGAREAKQPWQGSKWDIARRAGSWLSLIPSIQLVGVTGGLAMNNASRDDDIDLFIIVADGTLWVSRLLSTILMELLRLRRHPGDTNVADKVCLNMFMTRRALSLPVSDRDCFTAHEVLQMSPLWEQPGIYKTFLRMNQWVKIYLPNAWIKKITMPVTPMSTSFPLVIWYMRFFEWPSKYMQLWYMKHHRTSEVITDTTLRFHPRDARVWIKRWLGSRLKHYHIPLDKIFYAG